MTVSTQSGDLPTFLSPCSCYYYADRIESENVLRGTLFSYVQPFMDLANKINEIVPSIILPLAQIIAMYAEGGTKTGILDSHAALPHVYRQEETSSLPCALPDNILSILSEELSPAEKAVWGANENGTPYCVSDIYQLVYVNPDELKTRVQKLETMLEESKIANHSEFIKDLIEMIKRDLTDANDKGWALISKRILPNSKNQNPSQTSGMLKNISCLFPTPLLVHTMLLDTVLAYLKFKVQHQPFKTIAYRQQMLEAPLLPHMPAFKQVFSTITPISFTGDRLEKEPDFINAGALAVRKWNLPASTTAVL